MAKPIQSCPRPIARTAAPFLTTPSASDPSPDYPTVWPSRDRLGSGRPPPAICAENRSQRRYYGSSISPWRGIHAPHRPFHRHQVLAIPFPDPSSLSNAAPPYPIGGFGLGQVADEWGYLHSRQADAASINHTREHRAPRELYTGYLHAPRNGTRLRSASDGPAAGAKRWLTAIIRAGVVQFN